MADLAHNLTLLIHLLGFAGFAGGFVAAHLLHRAASARDGGGRTALAGAAAKAATLVALPAILVSVLSGVVLLAINPIWLKGAWLHAKLGLVVLLLVLAHLDMFATRRSARALAADDGAAAARAASRLRWTWPLGLVLIAAVVTLATLKPF